MTPDTPPPATEADRLNAGTLDAAEVKRLQAVASANYRRRIGEAQAQYRDDLNAINAVAQLNGIHVAPAGRIDYIREAINAQAGDFTIPMLADWIKRHHPNAVLGTSTISARVHRLRAGDNPQIEVIRRGGGRSSGVYRKPSPKGQGHV